MYMTHETHIAAGRVLTTWNKMFMFLSVVHDVDARLNCTGWELIQLSAVCLFALARLIFHVELR